MNNEKLMDKDSNFHTSQYSNIIDNNTRRTPIQEFYAGQSIFITGIYSIRIIHKHVP